MKEQGGVESIKDQLQLAVAAEFEQVCGEKKSYTRADLIAFLAHLGFPAQPLRSVCAGSILSSSWG